MTINPIAPHCPPVPQTANQSPLDDEQDTGASTTFDHLLSEQSTAAKPPGDDDGSAPDATPPARSSRATREKADKQAASTPPDVLTMAAQMTPLVDLRTITLPLTLSPEFGPIAPPDGGAFARAGAGMMADASTAGAPGDLSNGTKNDASPGPAIIERPVNAATATVAPPLLALPGLPSADKIATPPGAPAAHEAPTAADIPVARSVGDSRLAMPPQLVPEQTKASTSLPPEQAKIAASKHPKSGTVQTSNIDDSQALGSKLVVNKSIVDGTAVAEEPDVVNANLLTKDEETDTSVPAKRGGSVAMATPAGGKAGGSRAPGSDVILSAAISGAATVDLSTAQIAAGAAPAETTVARQIVKVETLLQNALSIGESVRPDGQGQMEMRVRLGGGAEDVTVRMEVANDQLQVTFQTNSAELNKALASGWQQFSATAAQTSTLSLAQPRFETGNFVQAATGAPTDASNFSSGQQDSRRQEPEPMVAEDISFGRPARGSQGSLAAASTAGQASEQRWNRWA